MKQSRKIGFAVIACVYILAAALGIVLFRFFSNLHIFTAVLIADAGATAIVFLAGGLLSNATVYDPYWSVAPPIVLTGIALIHERMHYGTLLLLIAVWYWGVRLTYNWAYTFRNLNTQDWRYDNFKFRFPRAFQLISFLGIHIFPTLVVYLCMLPGITLIEADSSNALASLGFLICIGAATLQMIADRQMHRFRHGHAGENKIIRSGLWKHSRHPNYLGEIMMWWGVYFMMLSASPGTWYLCLGPLVNTLMFLFISIPMADKRNRDRRPGFGEYSNETNRLLPFRFPKK
jgi:steroid 5-alpha reductase family enzyme